MVRLDNVYADYLKSIATLSAFRAGISGPPKVQAALAELVLLRLFFRIEAFVKESATRVCCAARYLDNTFPALLVPSRSKLIAASNMRTLGRTRPRELKWTMGADIKGNVEKLVDPCDLFYTTVTNHEAELDRLRRIRNHIAHGNRDTSKKFRPVVVHHYGAALPHILPGTLLLSARFTPPVLDQAFVFSRVFAKDLVRA